MKQLPLPVIIGAVMIISGLILSVWVLVQIVAARKRGEDILD
ncbi:MAG: hypothetical protein RIQ31_850 [Actinomycetota bacterium]